MSLSNQQTNVRHTVRYGHNVKSKCNVPIYTETYLRRCLGDNLAKIQKEMVPSIERHPTKLRMRIFITSIDFSYLEFRYEELVTYLEN